MPFTVEPPEELIGPAGVEVVAGIADGTVRERVARGLVACAGGLGALDGLDLEQHEMADIGTPDLSVWNAAAPEVRTVLLAVHESLEKLAEVYPPCNHEPGGDSFVDVVLDGHDDETVLAPIREDVSVQIDEIVGRAADARVGETVAELTGMLKQELHTFGQRLRSPQVVSHRWVLLGELQEFRAKCSKCLEAIATTILASVGATGVEEALPRYSTEARRAAALRAAVIDLAYDVHHYRELLKEDDIAVAHRVRVAVGDRLCRFSADPTYRFIRALDKREVILFRLRIGAWTPVESTAAELRDLVEGFDKFLELMRGINRREQLIHEDRRHLREAKRALQGGNWSAALGHLQIVYGRDRSLDDWLRQHRLERDPAPEALSSLVDEALAAMGPA